MKISFSPMRRDNDGGLTLFVNGDTLTVNGEDFDFTALPEGATLPREAVAGNWLVSDVDRVAGEIALTVLLPHGPNAAQTTLFPEPVTVVDGAVPVPAFSEESADV